MKITKTLYLAFFITLINVSVVLADPPADLPEPEPEIPPPPGGAIDQNIMIFLAFALIFGIYTIYRYNLNKKASM